MICKVRETSGTLGYADPLYIRSGEGRRAFLAASAPHVGTAVDGRTVGLHSGGTAW